ncbi:MAG: RsmB/NOP family class I SAM-dependent RNA methyltransferase, partial [Clostridia bacterium]|nr:RsmB/NOP family class I SAM-dependent RNA methyltransferase [Clostridia bacterium]
MIQLPEKYVCRMKMLLGEEYSMYEQAMETAPSRGFRVNTEKISIEDFERINIFGSERIPYVENGFYLDYDGKIGNHPYHHAGMIYVQEPAAMAPAECVDLSPDWWVLDMCAAPGGKSTQLKNKLGADGVLVSNEIISSRCRILTGNVERLGLTNTVTTCMDTAKLSEEFPEVFDLIMVDAPCSGEGMFRKEEIAIDEWSEENVLMCASRQAEILENAAKALRGGGYIIYATCTFSLEENEMTVDAFLRRHPEFEIVPVKKEVELATSPGLCFEGCTCENISYARRFYPHKGRGEGQFMAVLHSKLQPTPRCERMEKNDIDRKSGKEHRSKGDNVDKGKRGAMKHSESGAEDVSAVNKFLSDTLIDHKTDAVKIYNGNPVYFSSSIEIRRGVAFSCGVCIGEIRKGYIQPHHQFFMAMGKNFKRKIELGKSEIELSKYLHGESFDTSCDDGWAVVTVHG